MGMYKEAIAGALSYNGQRCTALKLFFVPKPHGMTVAKELSSRIEQMKLGMPWDSPDITPLPNQKRIDFFRNIFGKININSQCSRSPDVLPFSGRRSSAMGVMSISNIINEFSVPTVISYKDPKLQSFVEESIPSLSSFIPSTTSSTP